VETEKKTAHGRGFLIDEQAVKGLSFRLIRKGGNFFERRRKFF